MAWKFSPIFRYRVNGSSMEPTYKHGQQLLVNRLAYLFTNPKQGEVVVIKHPENNISIIKRVQSSKGNSIFVLGDNTKSSTDSRHFGWLGREHFIGKVITK